MNKPKIAIIYDFDKTLSKTNMQAPLIKKLGMEEAEFWNLAKQYAKKNNMDQILAYLYCLKDECKKKGLRITRNLLNNIGKEVEFYNGLDQWFEALNRLGEEIDVEINHFIISSGLKEIIEGTKYNDKFKIVYACKYLYNDEDEPIWIKNAINYTTKTQLLFRINKGAFEIYDDAKVNEFIEHDERDYPFDNMIYIRDGESDIPCMKLVSGYGGFSIGVYNEDKRTVQKLRCEDRLDLYCKADYSTDEELYHIVETMIRKIRYSSPLRDKSCDQYLESEKENEKNRNNNDK